MVDPKRAWPGNSSGDFFVDETCIDCDTCRWVARDLFTRVGDGSAVTRQPATAEERRQSFLAMRVCPTVSIGCTGDKTGLKDADFPLKLDDKLYYLGYASEKSFGAAAYLLVRPGGNIMVDSPRFHEPLAKAIAALGPVKWLVLTHRDDVADHAQWADERYLFTGDHLEFDEDEQSLRAFKDFCWFDWKEQVKSMQRMLDLKFEWVLPGHGRMKQAPKEQMHTWLLDCLQWMKQV